MEGQQALTCEDRKTSPGTLEREKMHPILFRIPMGGQLLLIKSYSFFFVLAIIAVVSISFLFLVKRGLSWKQAFIFLLLMVLAVPIGSRMLHILSNYDYYAGDVSKMLNLHPVGFALYGGLTLAVISAWMACRVMQLDLWRVADAVTPGLGIGIAITRIGCYLNGCCYGKSTELAWGVTFPPGSPANVYQLLGNKNGINIFDFFSTTAVHPTQIYELLAAVLGTILAVYILRKQKNDGVAFLVFVLWFTTFRWINWHFRVPSQTLEVPLYFYPILYGCILIIAGFLLYRRSRVSLKT